MGRLVRPSWSHSRQISRLTTAIKGYVIRRPRDIKNGNCRAIVNSYGRVLAYAGLVVEDGKYLDIDFYVFDKELDREKARMRLFYGITGNLKILEKAPLENGTTSLGVQYAIY